MRPLFTSDQLKCRGSSTAALTSEIQHVEPDDPLETIFRGIGQLQSFVVQLGIGLNPFPLGVSTFVMDVEVEKRSTQTRL